MIQSINPATGDVVATFTPLDSQQIDAALAQVAHAQREWAAVDIEERASRVRQLGNRIRARRDDLARLATLEMGKPIVQAETELDKSADACDFFAANGPDFLAPESIATRFDDAFVRFEPLGVILAVMPWNFPFWQVFRQLAPALVAGNGVVLKHASNVPQCSMAIEEVVLESGFPAGLERSLLIPGAAVKDVIADPRVSALCLTGSSEVGAEAASIAAGHLKKQILELGGSDPFIVLGDADVTKVAEEASRSRNLNAGQSCVAAKRFLIEQSVYDEFVEELTAVVAGLEVGDPFDRTVDVGPLARPDLVTSLVRQVEESVADGAKVVTGGDVIDGPGNFYVPSVVSRVTPEMAVFSEETFGPVAAVLSVTGDDEAVALSNLSDFGLGASVWSPNIPRALSVAHQLEAGAVFINGRVSSDPRLPFGGIKQSGYGRELGSFGIRELTSIKAVAVNR